MKNPKVTVLMPVYNAEKYLKEAIESILGQTFKDFEFLIINDGSTDNSEKIILSYKDERIRYIKNDINIKLIKTLNKGIDLAKGEYIARMDADDISLPRRIEKQITFMDSHPEIGISGTWTKTIGNHNGYINKFVTNPEELKANLLFFTSLAHPTVIIKKEILNKYNLRYNELFPHVEDYELWSKASEYTKISNIPEVLLLYRTHKESVSSLHSEIQGKNANIIRANLLKNLKIFPNDNDIKIHTILTKPKEYKIEEFLLEKEKWLLNLIEQNKKIKYYKEPYFSNIIKKIWLLTCYVNGSNWKIFQKSKLSKKILIKEPELIFKFFIKCLLKKQ